MTTFIVSFPQRSSPDEACGIRDGTVCLSPYFATLHTGYATHPLSPILARAFAKHILVFYPAGQPLAVQNRSRRFCRGELTEQWRKDNPDLISGERQQYASCIVGIPTIPGHNSAEALLAKIKAEREAMQPKKKPCARKMTA